MEGYYGEIRLFAGNYAPQNWALCNGQMLNIPQNTALFAVLGTQYGGDGQKTFQLPNLAPLKEAQGEQTPIQYIICIQGLFPARG